MIMCVCVCGMCPIIGFITVFHVAAIVHLMVRLTTHRSLIVFRNSKNREPHPKILLFNWGSYPGCCLLIMVGFSAPQVEAEYSELDSLLRVV